MEQQIVDKRVVFDFEVDFTNGGGIQGQDFRLDITGDDIADAELADYIVRDMRLLMVGEVRILNKHIITEPHKRKPVTVNGDSARLIDLSHVIEDGLITYKGLPAPIICDYLSREESRKRYAEGTEFQIGKIEMVTNTGTYIDCPFHRYPDGKDVSEFDLDRFVDIDAITIRADYQQGLVIDKSYFEGKELRGRAVLVNTSWGDAYWNTPQYHENHPFLTEDAANYLKQVGAKLVGIDALNIDDTRGNARPVHTILLGAEILIVEHLCHLDSIPDEGYTFSAVPPKFKGVGTFPVRAYAKLI
jgi:arylformamidase